VSYSGANQSVKKIMCFWHSQILTPSSGQTKQLIQSKKHIFGKLRM